MNTLNTFLESGKFQIVGESPGKSKGHYPKKKNEEQTELKECLLPFGPESSIFQSDIKNTKLKHIKLICSSRLKLCKTWSLTLREEHRMRVFEDGAQENIWA
jgi:hypothetical protein